MADRGLQQKPSIPATQATPGFKDALSPQLAATPSPPTAITVQLPPQSEPVVHWTAYLTAGTTPVIALMAGVIAYKNWRTSQNKLKFDLHVQRMQLYTAIDDVRKRAYTGVAWQPSDDLTEFLALRVQARWIFDKKVNRWLNKTLSPLLADYSGTKETLEDLDEAHERKGLLAHMQKIESKLFELRPEMQKVFTDALTLRH